MVRKAILGLVGIVATAVTAGLGYLGLYSNNELTRPPTEEIPYIESHKEEPEVEISLEKEVEKQIDEWESEFIREDISERSGIEDTLSWKELREKEIITGEVKKFTLSDEEKNRFYESNRTRKLAENFGPLYLFKIDEDNYFFTSLSTGFPETHKITSKLAKAISMYRDAKDHDDFEALFSNIVKDLRLSKLGIEEKIGFARDFISLQVKYDKDSRVYDRPDEVLLLGESKSKRYMSELLSKMVRIMGVEAETGHITFPNANELDKGMTIEGLGGMTAIKTRWGTYTLQPWDPESKSLKVADDEVIQTATFYRFNWDDMRGDHPAMQKRSILPEITETISLADTVHAHFVGRKLHPALFVNTEELPSLYIDMDVGDTIRNNRVASVEVSANAPSIYALMYIPGKERNEFGLHKYEDITDQLATPFYLISKNNKQELNTGELIKSENNLNYQPITSDMVSARLSTGQRWTLMTYVHTRYNGGWEEVENDLEVVETGEGSRVDAPLQKNRIYTLARKDYDGEVVSKTIAFVTDNDGREVGLRGKK